ncbi:helix-turn-helix transcriptional regulator [Entomomonas asaccharolytica]|uniref:AlpA family transcriptional regulator n=1 Tax=Entomomonas asaccharolytica TaxID=2785331 RepID=A0A974NGN4_9GAMM|nr:AlpA family transcriptional regulator [Entomomonas asaccharolytica]QQP86027.1 AlpA family transcriptional regulator [Entomomonas asaccharolytica]
MNNKEERRLIKLPTVMELTGLARPTIYLYIKKDKFPQCIKVGSSSFWEYNEVQQWIADQINNRNQLKR